MWKKRAFKITIGIVLGLLVSMIIATSICTVLALQDNYADKYTVEKTSDSISISGRLVQAAWNGEEAVVSDDDLNQWLLTYLNLPKETNGASLNHLAIHNRTDCTDVYFQITYNGFNLAFYSKVHLSVDTEQQKIYAEIQEMKVGELGIPSFLMGKILTKALSSYDFLTIDGSTVSFSSAFSYNSADIKVLELNAVESGLRFKTNELKEEAIKYIEEKVEETIEDWSEKAKKDWEAIQDNFSEYIEKFQAENNDSSQNEDSNASLDDITENIQGYVEEFKNEHADEISDIEEKLDELSDTLSEYWQQFKDNL